MWENKIVTYQCRDFTNKQEIKYMACPEVREIVHHKNILYGHPSLWAKSEGILVEGPLDVWRLGVNACATAGTGYTPQQLRLISKTFKKLYIIFDPEPIAQAVAKRLQEELSFRGVKTYIYNQLTTDPGDMTQVDANHLLKELNFNSI
jgi:DNA primase (bacterial type)